MTMYSFAGSNDGGKPEERCKIGIQSSFVQPYAAGPEKPKMLSPAVLEN